MLLLQTCVFAALGGFLFGYDLGLIGGALMQIQRELKITSSLTVEAIVGAAKLGATLGTFVGGAAMARYGRQRTITGSTIAFTVGPLLMAVAPAPWLLVVGRFVTGIGIGISATVCPTYIAEVAPAASRGALVQLYEVMLCVGMLLAPLVDWMLSGGGAGTWRWMVGMPALPGLALAAAPWLVPESPRWLVMRNRLDEALELLTKLMRSGGGTDSKRPWWERGNDYERIASKASTLRKWESVMRRTGFGGTPALVDMAHAEHPTDPDSWYVLSALALPTPPSRPGGAAGEPQVAVMFELYRKEGGRWWYYESPPEVPALEQFTAFWELYGGEQPVDQPWDGLFEYTWLAVPPVSAAPAAGAHSSSAAAAATSPSGADASGWRAQQAQQQHVPLAPGWLVDDWSEPEGWVYLDTARDPQTGLTPAELARATQDVLTAQGLREDTFDYDSWYFRSGRFYS